MSGQQHSTDGEVAALPVAGVHVSGEEQETFPRVLTEQGKDPFDIQEEVGDSNAPPPVVLEARLTKCLRSLYDLWKEFEFGFSGCKEEKNWTDEERGKGSFKYYKRNVF
jgi:hypothetical protein